MKKKINLSSGEKGDLGFQKIKNGEERGESKKDSKHEFAYTDTKLRMEEK